MDKAHKPVSNLLARAQGNLSVDASDEVRKRINEKLRDVASELALEWISGERRFENQSQQIESWLARLYEELFVDEQPTPAKIYARFGLPLSRSQYFSRLLFARRSGHWRDRARHDLKEQLRRFADKAERAINEKRGKTQSYEMSLSRGAFEELGEDLPAPPKRIPGVGTFVRCSITAEAVLALIKELAKDQPNV
jgi:hypothetical protein